MLSCSVREKTTGLLERFALYTPGSLSTRPDWLPVIAVGRRAACSCLVLSTSHLGIDRGKSFAGLGSPVERKSAILQSKTLERLPKQTLLHHTASARSTGCFAHVERYREPQTKSCCPTSCGILRRDFRRPLSEPLASSRTMSAEYP